MSFTQLRVISSGTLLASPIRVADLVRATKENGYDAMALTDVNVVYNLVAFYDAAQQAGIKPLLGMQLSLEDDQMVLIAENLQGYEQLQKISTAVQFDHQTLAELPDFTGLAVITTEQGAVEQAFAQGDGNEAAQVAAHILAKAPASFNIGLANLQADPALIQFAEIHGWHAVMLGDVRELTEADGQLRRVLTAIHDDQKLSQVTDDVIDYRLPERQMFVDVLENAGFGAAVAGTMALVDRCDVTLPVRHPELPAFPLPEATTNAQYLRELAVAGLQRQVGPTLPAAYQERLDYELGVIDQMGFADYFLIVQDIIQAVNNQGIMTGPGRGSAAGSLVAFALGITAVDPLTYGLLFERFLNPNRGQMPDIDIDVQDDRRAEVLAYVQEKYGNTHTAQIMATGTFGPRQAVRDAAKVMGMASYAIDQLAGEIPSKAETIAEALAANQRLRDMQRDEVQVAAVLQVAANMVGLPRTVTTHAAGIVLSSEAMTDVIGLQKSGVGIGVQTQVTKEYVERLGLLKIDILGLRTLSMLTQMQNFVRRQFNTAFNLDAIPLDDSETLRLFADGNTVGIFQFESRPMRSVLRKVHPESFGDVVATAALYRPGPMQYIDEFADRLHGRQQVAYATPLLEPLLAPTYGIIVYQEQVMQVANVVGGMSLAAADDLRRAMSKKKQAVIDAGLTTFVAGAAERGVSAADAKEIYSDIEKFAGYGFNRSHAVAYGVLAFWMAFIKQHYPAAFYAVQLNANLGNQGKTQIFVSEAKTAGVKLLPPDINASTRGYRIVKGKIRVGLNAIKGLRRDVSEGVIAARGDTPWPSMQAFLLALAPAIRNEGGLLPLAQAGAFDQFARNRAHLIAGLAGMLDAVNLAGGDAQLLAAVWPSDPDVPDMTQAACDAMTADKLGYYLAGHPVDRFAVLKSFYQIDPLTTVKGRAQILVVISDSRVITTKKGTKMAFLTVQDATATAEVTVFPQQYLQAGTLTPGAIYLMTIELDRGSTQAEPRFVARTIREAVKVVASLPDRLFLNLGENPDVNMKKSVLRTLMNHHGRTQVIVVTNGKPVLLGERYAVTLSADMERILKDLLGENAVVIQKPTIA